MMLTSGLQILGFISFTYELDLTPKVQCFILLPCRPHVPTCIEINYAIVRLQCVRQVENVMPLLLIWRGTARLTEAKNVHKTCC